MSSNSSLRQRQRIESASRQHSHHTAIRLRMDCHGVPPPIPIEQILGTEHLSHHRRPLACRSSTARPCRPGAKIPPVARIFLVELRALWFLEEGFAPVSSLWSSGPPFLAVHLLGLYFLSRRTQEESMCGNLCSSRVCCASTGGTSTESWRWARSAPPASFR